MEYTWISETGYKNEIIVTVMRNFILRLKTSGLIVITLVTLTALLSGAISGCGNKMDWIRSPTVRPTPPGPTLYPDADPSSLQAAPEVLRAILSRPIVVSKDPANPLLSAPIAWVGYYMEHPVVMKEGDTYHMYFHGVPPGDEAGYRIGHATAPSPRGPWTVDHTPTLDITSGAWDSAYVATPYVMKIGDTFYMWYSGYDSTQIRTGLATAKAPEGPFLKHPANPLTYVSDPVMGIGVVEGWVGSVLNVENQYRMWYGPELQLYYGIAEQPEGPWRYAKLGVFERGPPGSWNKAGTMGEAGVVFFDRIYYMFFSGFKGIEPGIPDKIRPFEIGMAVSLDGMNWYQSPYNPIIKRGMKDSYDYWRLSEVGVYFEDGVFYVYYTSTGPPDLFPAGTETISLAEVKLK